MDEQQQTSKRIRVIASVSVGIILLLLAGWLLWQKQQGNSPITAVTSLFGTLGSEVIRPIGDAITPGTDDTANGANEQDGAAEEPLFRQLSTIPVAGATTIVRDGKTYVRYVAKENGYTYEVDPKTGKSVQLTNTTIPRIYEAYWGNNGESVVLRYLSRDSFEQDTIKTYLAYLSVPKNLSASTTTPPVLGALVGDYLPDQISAVSISPDGTKMFYLLELPDGTRGSIMTLATKSKKEVFQSTFREWLPQLFNNETVLVTTKASGAAEGFAYLYNPKDRSFSRIIRDKNGLTTLGVNGDNRVLFSERKNGKLILHVYDPNGYTLDEGLKIDTIDLELSSLPEKCVWSKNHVRIFCAAFAATPRGLLPDEWYQSAIAFQDMFWTANTDTSEITFLADPIKQESAKNQSFDVINPMIDTNEEYFVFTNKNDLTLWSMRIMKEKYLTPDEPEIITTPEEVLTPDEMKDALGSTKASSTKK